MHHIIEKDQQHHIFQEKEIDAIDLTDVNLVHITGIPPALSQSARKATFRLMQRAKDKWNFYHI